MDALGAYHSRAGHGRPGEGHDRDIGRNSTAVDNLSLQRRFSFVSKSLSGKSLQKLQFRGLQAGFPRCFVMPELR